MVSLYNDCSMGVMETQVDMKWMLVMVPHRDARGALRKYSDELVRDGITGVYRFPLAVPIAALSKPLTPDELKNCARILRDAAGAGGGKFSAKEEDVCPFPARKNAAASVLFGPRLDLKIPSGIFSNVTQKIKRFFSPLIIGAFLMPKDHEVQLHAAHMREMPEFRAAAAANMLWQPVQTDTNSGGETAYKWKIEKLCWLPRKL